MFLALQKEPRLARGSSVCGVSHVAQDFFRWEVFVFGNIDQKLSQRSWPHRLVRGNRNGHASWNICTQQNVAAILASFTEVPAAYEVIREVTTV